MKLTIGKKLLGGFLFVLILLVIESVVSNNVINSTQQSYKKLIDENIENVMLAHELDNYYIKQSDAVKSYILTGDEDIFLNSKSMYKKQKIRLIACRKPLKQQKIKKSFNNWQPFNYDMRKLSIRKLHLKKKEI